eukprot:6490588-Amphidinium_carterae.1
MKTQKDAQRTENCSKPPKQTTMPHLRLRYGTSNIKPITFAPGSPRLRISYSLAIPRLRNGCASSRGMWLVLRRSQCATGPINNGGGGCVSSCVAGMDELGNPVPTGASTVLAELAGLGVGPAQQEAPAP